jgi:hypothetical protein
VSNFDKVATVVLEQQRAFVLAGLDRADDKSVMFCLGDIVNEDYTILRVTIWHSIRGDELPIGAALLVTDAAILLGYAVAVDLLTKSINGAGCLTAEIRSCERAVEVLNDCERVPYFLPDVIRHFQVMVLLELFSSDLWRDGHAHLAERLRFTLGVALSWCDQQKEAVE